MTQYEKYIDERINWRDYSTKQKEKKKYVNER